MKKKEIFSVVKNSNLLLKDITIFKNYHNIYISEEYTIFLLEYNYNRINSDLIAINRIFEDGFSQKFYLRKFFTFEEFKDSYLYFHQQNLEDELVQESVSIIGMTAGRTCICIGIGKNNVGQIFLWDGDFGVTKQAENLDEFFDSLKLDENIA